MLNFTKRSINDLFSEDSLPDYAVIVTELRNRNGRFASEDHLNEALTACSNLMTASYVNHYCEKADQMILCFLNYNASVFSIRSFVGSLRQTMYSISQQNRSYVCYAEDLQDRHQMLDECFFLINAVRYGILLGASRPLTSVLLHRLEKSNLEMVRNITFVLYNDLTEKKYDQIIDYLGQAERTFLNLTDGGEPYAFPEMMNYISGLFTVFCLFFQKQNYHFPFMDENIFTLLYQNNGCAGLIKVFAESLAGYRNNFISVPVSEREQKNMQDILAHISNNLATATLSETASHFALTDAYLCRLFKKNMGLNFTEYVKEKRLETALRLLQSDEKKTVSAISQAVGMKSQSYFQNLFKSKYGITPEEYRKSYRLFKNDLSQ